MKNWISTTISIVAIIISMIALAFVIPTDMSECGLDFDYIGAIIGVLSFLVTLLLGYQIYTVINVKEELKEIQKERAGIESTIKTRVENVKAQMKKDISNLLPVLIAIDSDEICDMISTAMKVHQEAEKDSIAESFSDGVIMSFLNKGIPEDDKDREKYLVELSENLDSEGVANYYTYFLQKDASERKEHQDIEKILVKLISILADKKMEDES